MNTVIATNHHRPIKYYDFGINLLKKAGYPVIQQDTTGIPYDSGMMKFKDILTDFDIVVFIDNDLFLYGLEYFNQLLSDFKLGGYGFCSYFEVGSEWHYKRKGTIAPVEDQQFEIVGGEYGFKPKPHWENAYMLFAREAWDKLSPDDLSNSRKMIKAVHEKGIKMGAHKAEYKWTYSHYGPEWFHVGNLMRYFYILEQMNFSGINLDSNVDASRIGFFLAQGNDYGFDIYTKDFNNALNLITQSKGKQYFLEKWNELLSRA